MSSWRFKAALLSAAALVATPLALIGGSGGEPEQDRLAELFDPSYLATGVCRAGAKRQAFKPSFRLAMASAVAATSDAEPPLWDNLGGYSHPITTSEPLAQQYFDQGLRLTYAFNHAEALRAFQHAATIDPNCAMCYWGQAFVVGANINAPMDPDAANPAVQAIERAKTLAENAGEHEQALIEALAARYSADPEADPAALAEDYRAAMAEVRARFPDDAEVAVLYADAVMNTTPWDYWEIDGRTPKAAVGDGIAAIEATLAVNPDHPGAIHLYIHLMEASMQPERAEPHADRLAALMPGAGHIVHMPAHIYIRVGRHLDSITANRAAVEADEAFIAQVASGGFYPYTYYPHNIHFVLQSAQLAGDAASTMWAIEKLDGKVPDDIAATIGWTQAIKTAPYFGHAQFSDPETILALPDPGDEFPLVKAMWHYARGVGLAAKGDLEGASSEAALIADINAKEDFQMLRDWTVPAPDMLRLARHVVEGRIAQAAGDQDKAVSEFRTAVEIQDSLPYMEPAYWYYPVRQSLGAALLAAGQAEEAEQVFRKSLVAWPNNGWALYGLATAQKARGDTGGASQTEQLWQKAWIGEAGAPDLAQL